MWRKYRHTGMHTSPSCNAEGCKQAGTVQLSTTPFATLRNTVAWRTSLGQVKPAPLLCPPELWAVEQHGPAAGRKGCDGEQSGLQTAHLGLRMPAGGLPAGDASFPTHPALRLLGSFKDFHF